MMITFIAQRIMEARDKSLAEGRTKYGQYFVNPSALRLYGKYKADVDAILAQDGYEDCIVTA